jgi:hypothetical protein
MQSKGGVPTAGRMCWQNDYHQSWSLNVAKPRVAQSQDHAVLLLPSDRKLWTNRPSLPRFRKVDVSCTVRAMTTQAVGPTPKRLQRWKRTISAALGATAEGVAYLLHEINHDISPWITWPTAGVGAALVIYGSATSHAEARKRERELLATEEATRIAREFVNLQQNAIRCVQRIAVSPDGTVGHAKARLQEIAVAMAATFAPNARGCYFELKIDDTNPDHPVRTLRCDDRYGCHRGRPTDPRVEFRDSVDDEAGRQIFGYIDAKRAYVVPDTEGREVPGLERNSEYKTFMNIPIVAGNRVYGFLGIDSTNPGDLAGQDDPAKQIGLLLSTGLAIGELEPMRPPVNDLLTVQTPPNGVKE